MRYPACERILVGALTRDDSNVRAGALMSFGECARSFFKIQLPTQSSRRNHSGSAIALVASHWTRQWAEFTIRPKPSFPLNIRKAGWEMTANDPNSLPHYPVFPHATLGGGQENPGRRLSPRAVRVLRDFTFLAGFVALLYWLSWLSAAIVQSRTEPVGPPRYDFDFVIEGYSKINLLSTRAEVEYWLGPPTNRVFPPELEHLAQQADGDRHRRLPREREWNTWSDPDDDSRWVAVLFGNGKVYWIHKNGFTVK